MMAKISDFLSGRCGNVSIIFALSAIVVVGVAGLGLEYNYWTNQKTRMQDAADAGALYGAVVLGRGGKQVVSRAEDAAAMAAASNKNNMIASATVARIVNQATGTVEVTLTTTGTRFLSGIISQSNPTITATSKAKIVDQTVACIYALNTTASSAFNGNGNTIVQGANCGIQVNSTNANAMTNSGTITASNICVAGNYSGVGYTPTPTANCPATADPFASTVIPAPGACTSMNLIINADRTFLPMEDVFCGGLQVTAGATVTFQQGVYHFVDGPLQIASSASIAGTEVAFVLSGTATLDISGNGQVSTTPPDSGDLEGFSIVQDRNAPFGGTNRITGQGDFDFPGIIYLSRSELDIAGRAAGNIFTPTYAVIVADTIKISGSGELNVTADTSNFTKKDSTALTVVNATLVE